MPRAKPRRVENLQGKVDSALYEAAWKKSQELGWTRSEFVERASAAYLKHLGEGSAVLEYERARRLELEDARRAKARVAELEREVRDLQRKLERQGAPTEGRPAGIDMKAKIGTGKAQVTVEDALRGFGRDGFYDLLVSHSAARGDLKKMAGLRELPQAWLHVCERAGFVDLDSILHEVQRRRQGSLVGNTPESAQVHA